MHNPIKLVLLLLVASVASAQSTVLTKTTVLVNTTKFGAPTPAPVTVTVLGGGTSAGYETIGNNGNNGNALASFFYTAAPSSGTITLNSLNLYVDAVDSSGTTGLALYNVNDSTLTQVVLCTGTNTPVTGCTSGAAEYIGTIVGGSAGYAVGQNVFVYGFTNAGNNSGAAFPVVAYNSGYLILTNASAVAEIHAGYSLSVGSLVCGGEFGSTPTNDIFNSISEANLTQGTACPTLTASTWYAVVQVTSSATQDQGTSGVGSTCWNTQNVPIHSLFSPGSTTSATAWPTNITFNTGATSDGCYSAYASFTYLTTQPYTIVQAGSSWETTYLNYVAIAPVQSGHGFIAATAAENGGAAPIVSVVTTTGGGPNTGGSTVDTLTQRGTCPGVTGAGNAQVCILSVDRATAAVNGLTSTFTQGAGGEHNEVLYMEVAGTISSNSFDKSAYDTAYITTGPSFSSAVDTATTTQATELLVGVATDIVDCTGLVCTFTGTSGWNAVLTTTNPAIGAAYPAGLFYQIVTSTGAYGLNGSLMEVVWNTLPGLATFK